MADTFNPRFDRLSNYDSKSGVIMVRYGADAPITETELNEMQLIQNHKSSQLIKYLIGDGLSNDGSISYSVESSTVTIENKHAFVEGYHVFIDSLSVTIENGETLYLNVYEQTVGVEDTLKRYGNAKGVTIDNYIMDNRYNQEISKRTVLAYDLSTVNNTEAKTLTIGTLNNGVMEWAYTECGNSTVENSKSYLYDNPKEIRFTPAQLVSKRNNGDFSGLNIGDYKQIDLEGEFEGQSIIVEIAGIDVYNGSSTDYKHSIDFVVRDALCKYKMSDENSIGGFVATPLYSYLQTSIYNSLPSDWKEAIVPKKLLLEDKDNTESSGWSWHSMNLWLLSDIELFGYQSWSQKGYGTGNFKQYPLFKSESHLIKKFKVGDKLIPCLYWLLQPSTYGDKITSWCCCDSDGVANYDLVDYNGGVVFGFRI